MTFRYEIIALGDYFFDQIYTGLSRFPELGCEVNSQGLTTTGGAMFITAAALKRLDVSVGWAASFGNDYYSHFVRKLALEEGIDLSLARNLDRPFRLVTTSIPFDGERAFVTFTDPEPEDRANYWLDTLKQGQFEHLHLGYLAAKEELEPLVEMVRTQHATISMDCQDGPFLNEPEKCRELVSMVDIFMPNAREAMLVAEQADLQDAMHRLMELVDILVVKDGPNGSWVGHAGQIIHVPGIHAGPVVDTTGAGDCFNAGFLMGYVGEHQPLKTCALYGNICGGLSVTGVGGATAAPTRSGLMHWLSRIGGANSE